VSFFLCLRGKRLRPRGGGFKMRRICAKRRRADKISLGIFYGGRKSFEKDLKRYDGMRKSLINEMLVVRGPLNLTFK